MHWTLPSISKSHESKDDGDSVEKDVSKGIELLAKVEMRCKSRPHRSRIAGRKLTPDWDSALRLTKYAIEIFKSAHDNVRTIEAMCRISEIHKNIGLTSLAVRSLEDAADISKNGLKDYKKAADLYMQGYKLYADGGMFERAASCVVKAAEVLEDCDVDSAIIYYYTACKLYQEHARPLAFSIITNAADYSLRVGRFCDACKFIKMIINIHAQNLDVSRFSISILSLIIVLLKMQKYEEAEAVLFDVKDCYKECPGVEISPSPCVTRVAGDLIYAAKRHEYVLWAGCFGILLKYPLSKEILKLAVVSPFVVFSKSTRAAAINPPARRSAAAGATLLRKNPSVDKMGARPNKDSVKD